jgi:Fe-S-cluster containining protein
LAETLSDHTACMRGTRNRPRRCIALVGTIGIDVRCAIYEQRPSSCRAFAPGAAAGHGDARCGDARRLHGLPPLAGSYDDFPIA